jgi:ABC-type molybdate transport system substrate-binding protein
VHCPHADALTYNARMSAPRHRPRLPLPLSLTLAVISTIGGAMFAPSRAGAEALHIAVAANFRSAAEAVAGRFSATAGDKVIISAASTGVLAAQLRRGAPFDLLLAADQKRPQALVADGFAAGADWHPPITQYAVVSARSDRAAQAQAFLDFLDTAAGREWQAVGD